MCFGETCEISKHIWFSNETWPYEMSLNNEEQWVSVGFNCRPYLPWSYNTIRYNTIQLYCLCVEKFSFWHKTFNTFYNKTSTVQFIAVRVWLTVILMWFSCCSGHFLIHSRFVATSEAQSLRPLAVGQSRMNFILLWSWVRSIFIYLFIYVIIFYFIFYFFILVLPYPLREVRFALRGWAYTNARAALHPFISVSVAFLYIIMS